MPTAEELVRINMDKQMTVCNRTVQARGEINLYECQGVAVCVFLK
jgi:hypothetical protein